MNMQLAGIYTCRIYFKLLGMSFRSMLQFRADFLVGLLGVVTENAVNLLAISVVLGRFFDLAGWTVWEIVFLYGLWMTGNGLYALQGVHLYDLEEYLVQGSFDIFLVRPVNPLLMLLGTEVNIYGVGELIFGLASLSMAMTHLKLHFSPVHEVYLVTMLISSALIQLGIHLALSSVAFWTTRSNGLLQVVDQLHWNMTRQYPLEMFGHGFRVLVTAVIPVAFLNYYPARWLLGKTAPGHLGYVLSFLSPLVAMFLLIIAGVVWQKGIRRYSSTGS
jgi:ABC-2 type transport system permease protein